MVRWSRRGPLGAFTGLSLLFGSALSDQSYCSSENTGSDYPENFNPYQTNGSCRDLCRDGYAFAVVQYTSCWCTNFIPADQTDTGNCNTNCPGFPSEQCGNKDSGLYGYVPLGPPASGTVGGAAPAPAPTSEDPPSAPETVTDHETIIQTADPVTSIIVMPNPKPSEPAPVTTRVTNAQTSVRTTFINNTPITEYITIVPTSEPESTSSPSNGASDRDNEGGGASAGAIAGGVVGGVAGFAAIAGGLFFLLRRRRSRTEGGDDEVSDSGVKRNISTLSKTGLLRTRTEKEPTLPSVGMPGSSHGQESYHSTDQASGATKFMSPEWDHVIPVDQRLNKDQVMSRHPNGSSASLHSFQDDQDYTRTLNIRNPDPE